jgi:hypothetical protein
MWKTLENHRSLLWPFCVSCFCLGERASVIINDVIIVIYIHVNNYQPTSFYYYYYYMAHVSQVATLGSEFCQGFDLGSVVTLIKFDLDKSWPNVLFLWPTWSWQEPPHPRCSASSIFATVQCTAHAQLHRLQKTIVGVRCRVTNLSQPCISTGRQTEHKKSSVFSLNILDNFCDLMV